MRYLIIGFVVFLSHVVLTYQSNNELVLVPSAVMRPAGTVEYGFSSGFFVKNNTTLEADSSIFFRHAISDRFEYALTVGENLNPQAGIQGDVYQYVDYTYNLAHHVAVGVKNIGWNLSDRVTTEPVYDFYTVYSLKLLDQDSMYHVGYTFDRADNRKMLFFAGSEYVFKFGTTMAEWDGKSLNLGFKYTLNPGQNMYISVSPRPIKDGFNNPKYFTFGMTFSDNVFNQFRKKVVYVDQYTKEWNHLDTRLKIVEAKEKAMAEMLTTDFLEDLEASFIDRRLIEKKMDTETKSLVRGGLSHMQKGLEHYYAGKFQRALDEYKIVVSMLPDFAMGYVRLGSIYYQLGEKYKARVNWERALQLNPSNANLKLFLTRVLAEEKEESDRGSSENSLEEIEELAPTSSIQRQLQQLDVQFQQEFSKKIEEEALVNQTQKDVEFTKKYKHIPNKPPQNYELMGPVPESK